MWAYQDHPHTRTPGCPLISSKGQPFLRLSKHASYAMIIILCLRSRHCKTWKSLHRFLWFAAAKPAFSSALPPVPLYHILTLSKTPLCFFSLPSINPSIQKRRSLIIAWVTLRANLSPLCYLWVCPYFRPQLFFQAALFHLNFNPIYSLSFPLTRPGLSNYSSSELHVTQPCHKSLCWDMCAGDVHVCSLGARKECLCACWWWGCVSVRGCSGALSLCAALCSEKKEIVCLYLYVCVSSNEGIYACL